MSKKSPSAQKKLRQKVKKKSATKQTTKTNKKTLLHDKEGRRDKYYGKVVNILCSNKGEKKKEKNRCH